MDPAQRAHITRELHDVVAHSISIVTVQAAAAEAYLERDPAQAREHLCAVRRTAKEALADMRRLCGLAPGDYATRLPQPTLSRLGELLTEARAAGVQVRLIEHGRPPEVPPGVGLAAYRILQEALANVRRHAGAVSATVRVRYAPDAIELEVTNPVGDRRPAVGRGDGIRAMLDRAGMYGGSMDAGFEPGGVFAVRARLPL
jgi:signal transduction histidine kinase